MLSKLTSLKSSLIIKLAKVEVVVFLDRVTSLNPQESSTTKIDFDWVINNKVDNEFLCTTATAGHCSLFVKYNYIPIINYLTYIKSYTLQSRFGVWGPQNPKTRLHCLFNHEVSLKQKSHFPKSG